MGNQETQNSKKDIWDKLEIITTALIPLAVLLVGMILNSTIKTQDVRATYVEIASNVLRDVGNKELPPGLTIWALNILDESSPAPIPPELRAAALGSEILKEKYGYTSGLGFGGNTTFLPFMSEPNSFTYIVVDGEPRAITPVTLGFRTDLTYKIEWHDREGNKLCSISSSLPESHLYDAIICNTISGSVDFIPRDQQ
jgi:hypothetical protein